MFARTHLTPFAIGLIGSVSVLAGSLGVGWLGPDSVVRSWTAIEILRASPVAITVCALAVVFGVFALIVAWLGLRRLAFSDDPAATRVILTSAGAWTVPLLFSVPLFSRDLYAYVGQGRLMAAGLDPYTAGIATLPGWFGLGVDPMWANTATPYGPLWLWLEKLSVVAVGDAPPEVSIALFRMLSVVATVVLVAYALRLAERRGLPLGRTAWLVAASPLTLITLVVSAHNDSIMLAALVASVFYALERRPRIAVVLVVVAVAIKPIAILALPIIGVVMAGARSSVRTRIRYWLRSAATAAALLVGAGLVTGTGLGWIAAMQSPSNVMHWYAPLTVPVMAADALVRSLGSLGLSNVAAAAGEASGAGGDAVRAAAVVAAGIVVSSLMLNRTTIDPVRRLMLSFTALVLASTAIHPWYVLWLVVLVAVTDARGPAFRAHIAVLGVVVFSVIGLTEQLDITDATTASVVRLLTSGLAAACGVALVRDYLREEAVTASALFGPSAVRIRAAVAALGGLRTAFGRDVAPTPTAIEAPRADDRRIETASAIRRRSRSGRSAESDRSRS